jgi:uncharacterized iron-regulated protein
MTALLAVLTLPSLAAAQHGKSIARVATEGTDFRVYDGSGHPKSFADILASMDGVDVMLVGESHNDEVGHAVEAQLLYRAAERFGAVTDDPKRPVILSMEMFERDVQYIVDEYLEGLITEDQFLESARPWDNYQTDYRPLVEFARAHHLPVVAANAPRRYVNRVTRLGPESLDVLSVRAKESLPPLPYTPASPAYTQQWKALMKEMMASAPGPDSAQGKAAADSTGAGDALPQHAMGHALDAQALWDAAMGYSVTQALDTRPGAFVLHVAGSFHVERGTGIPEHIAEYRPGARVVTVVLEPSADIDKFSKKDDGGLGNFVVLTRKPAGEGDSGQ